MTYLQLYQKEKVSLFVRHFINPLIGLTNVLVSESYLVLLMLLYLYEPIFYWNISWRCKTYLGIGKFVHVKSLHCR